MPVDIFGHTDVKISQKTNSGGVTLSQVNNIFLRRDGETAAVGNINLNANKLVNLKDTIKSFKAICAGEYDHLPEAAFYMVGGIDEAIAKGEKLLKEAK